MPYEIIVVIASALVISEVMMTTGVANLLAVGLPGAAGCLTLPNLDRSGDPATRAAGIGGVRGFAGPTKTAWRHWTTRRRRTREAIFGSAVEAQQFSYQVAFNILDIMSTHGIEGVVDEESDRGR